MTRECHQKSRERIIIASLSALAALCYACWLTDGHFSLFWRPGNGLNLTFNSMLEHLLRGEFDVDPAAVGIEGFSRDGRIFAYWGIYFALIRWPLTLFRGGLSIDVTYLSCFVAVCIAAYAKLRTLRLVYLRSPASATRNLLYGALTLTILFAGPQIEFLRTTLFQEVCLWAGALAAIFGYFSIRGIILGRFSALSLCAMALVAGLALIARVSTGVGLYAALGLLVLTILIRAPREGNDSELVARRATPFAARILSFRFVLPILILLLFSALAGLVNYYRWGDPLVFADYRLYLTNSEEPGWLPLTQAYGLFNLSRIPFGIIYYFVPIWILPRNDGHLLLEEHQRRFIESTELPPSTFFLTDTLLMLLLLYALWSLLSARRSAGIDRPSALAIGSGLTAPCLLMLSAISMNFRYRIEFYPLIEFGAFLGFLLLCKHTLAATTLRKVRTLAIASTAVGILGSHVILIMYKVSAFGPAYEKMSGDVFHYYWWQLKTYWPAIASWIRH